MLLSPLRGRRFTFDTIFRRCLKINLNIVGSLMYRYRDYEEAVQRIASGNIVTAPLESAHFPFEEYEAAYRFVDDQGPKSLKVFIDL